MQTVCLRHRRGVIGDRVWKKFGPRRKRESEPSQSKPAALPALPKGELLDGVRNLTAPKNLSPWERWHCGAMTERVRTLAGGEPSQSKPAALPALPKGELLDGVRNLTASKKPLPLGEVALRSNDGEGKDACGRRTLSVKACGFASSPKGRALRRGEEPCGTEKPLPLGEVALRSNDGEGEDAGGRASPLSQSLAALPALPKGELLDGVRNLTAPKKPLPMGEVALRSNDGEGKAVSKKKGVFHEGDDGC